MLADTFLKRRISSWNINVEKYEKCHTLVLVKNDSKKTERIIRYAMENSKENDLIIILCVVKLPVTTDILLGRVLEPLGDEDMALTEIQRIVNSVSNSPKIDIKIMSGDPRTVITDMVNKLCPDLLVIGSSSCQKKGNAIKGRDFMICHPYHSFLELNDWIPVNEVARGRINPSIKERDFKVLFCHDYKNGYQEDACIHGHDSDNVYTITRFWSLIDIFVYFSHHTITIPPVSWINAAHTNNVLILGTIITEGAHGQLENMLMIFGDLKNKSSFSRKYADILVNMAVYYNFDGWFLNLESDLSQEYIPHLLQFLEYLKARMHSQKPGSMVLWYDALTVDGKVDWQDQLTLKNKAFFDVVDGIFTNYTWKETFPSESVELARGRNYDVFTGIDFWGRGQYGGGGFNVHKALREIKKAKTSVALFAPAWTWEFLGQESFEINEARLWMDSSVVPVLPIVSEIPLTWPDSKDIGCINEYLDSRPISNSFNTYFNTGVGTRYFINGMKVSDRSWSHLGRSDILPNVFGSYYRINNEDSFHGGSAIEIMLHKRESEKISHDNLFKSTYPLFKTDIDIRNGSSYDLVVKCSESLKIGLSLDIVDLDGKSMSIVMDEEILPNLWIKISKKMELSNAKTLKKVALSVYGSYNGIITVGRLRISSPVIYKTVERKSINLSVSNVTFDESKDEYSFWMSWIPTDTRFSELYINQVWVGTSFSFRYRVSLPTKDMGKLKVQILEYDCYGDLIGDLNGIIEF